MRGRRDSALSFLHCVQREWHSPRTGCQEEICPSPPLSDGPRHLYLFIATAGNMCSTSMITLRAVERDIVLSHTLPRVKHEVLRHAILCCVMLYTNYHIMLSYVMQCYAMLCYDMQCYTMLCNAIQCYTMICYDMQCYTMMCYALLCNDMQCYAIP